VSMFISKSPIAPRPIHGFIEGGVGLPIVVARHHLGIDLCHLLGDEAELRMRMTVLARATPLSCREIHVFGRPPSSPARQPAPRSGFALGWTVRDLRRNETIILNGFHGSAGERCRHQIRKAKLLASWVNRPALIYKIVRAVAAFNLEGTKFEIVH
jgi:hypothetical protein